MESDVERILRERLLEVFDKATDAEKRVMVSLFLTEMGEQTKRSYLHLLSEDSNE